MLSRITIILLTPSKGYFLDSSVTMKRHPSHVALELAIYGKERAIHSCYFEFKKKVEEAL